MNASWWKFVSCSETFSALTLNLPRGRQHTEHKIRPIPMPIATLAILISVKTGKMKSSSKLKDLVAAGRSQFWHILFDHESAGRLHSNWSSQRLKHLFQRPRKWLIPWTLGCAFWVVVVGVNVVLDITVVVVSSSNKAASLIAAFIIGPDERFFTKDVL